jgi:nitric oxide reductase NorD protein
VPEAEDVIVGVARHATSYAAELWRRNRARAPTAGCSLGLPDVRERLAFLLEAVFAHSFVIRIAAAPRPRTLLSRWFQRDARQRATTALPGTDGTSIFLPSCIEFATAEDALNLYRMAALQQAMRCLRGTAGAFPAGESLVVQDLFLISEAVAAERQCLALLPGLRTGMRTCRRLLLALRPLTPLAGEPLASVDALYRKTLADESIVAPAMTPQDSLAWARTRAAALQAIPTRYTGLVADMLLGEIVPRDAAAVALAQALPAQWEQGSPARSTRLARRPRVREAAAGEDDDESGIWMVQTSEPSEHVEDPMGLARPMDREPDTDLQGTAESISDLDALRLVSAPGTPKELLVSDDKPGRLRLRALPPTRAHGTAYPEWDMTIGAYSEQPARVRVLPAIEGSAHWVDDTLARNRATLTHVRRRFEALRLRRALFRAQTDEEDIDIDAFVNAYGDRRAHFSDNDRLYLMPRPARRDFALLILIDVSGSTDAWVCGAQRVIDIEKQALLIVCSALDALRVCFAIHAFSGYGRGDVRVREVKSCGQPYERSVARRIAGLEPDEYTRAGAALRHATAALMREPAHRRLLLLLSDGKPNDCDQYEGRYGIEDMRQALAEARLQGIAPFCVTVDRAASRQLTMTFGAGNFTVVREPPELSRALLAWLRAVATALR